MTSSTNPYDPPTTTAVRMKGEIDVSVLRKIQRAHRGLIMAFLGQLLVVIVFAFLAISLTPNSAEGSPREIALAIAGAIVMASALVFAVLVILNVVRLALALGWGSGSALLCLFGMFLGLVNLIVLVVVAGRAKARLSAAGLHVGLLGVSTKAFEAWAHRASGP